ncbi:pyridoxamine 5'-phosphate oxidase family protein [Aneurinibacillus sp. Ricciae_BoGa-3]|uniref:pyridoxamine 5'-phosphate oxidase family protein n=1 Tax=Aneurinibacillus sp. Ricciae_BoGa-3 TaxID=3022697 RepID=UPI0023410757|nr:pyridoxamine 5'-phosphate oxidase family protein [Aneurinibacillus sp. Ricciae_BoGa-3]WCK53110.1 pyridoxamine 5'-phosphate oxidase family protein [Aneurinibacillus sp. Ricciae_BoGa-3]
MAEVIAQSLNPELLSYLQTERFVMLTTMTPFGTPYVSAVSWVYAPDLSTVLIAAETQSHIVANVQQNSYVIMTVFGVGSVFAIVGEAFIKKERMENVPLKLSLLELRIKEVRDVMFYGSRLSYAPQYEKTYNVKAAEKLDRQVMEALKNA